MADIHLNINLNHGQVKADAIHPSKAQAMSGKANAVSDDKASKPARTAGAEAEKILKEQREAEEKRKDRIKEELENVVSVSEDGDTVQASNEGQERLEEDAFGRVVVKNKEEIAPEELAENIAEMAEMPEIDIPEEEQVEAAEEEVAPVAAAPEENIASASELMSAQPEDVAQAGQNITSFVGYTDSELEQMYLKGDISKQDYDAEMENRAEKKEVKEAESKEFGREIEEQLSKGNKADRDSQELREAFSPDASDKIKAGEKIIIMDNLEKVANGVPAALGG